MPTPIRKVMIHAHGDPSNVSVVNDIIDEPAKHEAQVQVVYSGLSGSDINMRLGWYPMQKKAPLGPGYCFVGRVIKNGPHSKKCQIGDMVACLSIYDSEADLINVPEKYLIPVPAGLNLQAACALILDWTTAYMLVMHSASVSKGQRVFVHGMSGAVGYGIMTLAQLQGAEVYGTASPRNHDAIRRLGGTAFDYGNKDWMQAMKAMGGAHAVFDPLGYQSWDESFDILAGGGVLCGYGGNLSMLTGAPRESLAVATTKLLAKNLCPSGRRAKFCYISRDSSSFEPDLLALFDLCLQGKIDVKIKRIYELEEVPQAHVEWNKGAGMGSLLIRLAGE
jgi:synaptic vesicle membrane protein VAT-1